MALRSRGSRRSHRGVSRRQFRIRHTSPAPALRRIPDHRFKTLKGIPGLIERGPLRVSHVLAVTALTAGLLSASFAVHPSPAFASADSVAAADQSRTAHAVTFDLDGTTTAETSSAATVADFLRAHGITAGPNDYVDPAVDVPLSDGLAIAYRPAVAVTIQTKHGRVAVTSSAVDVGELLDDQHVSIGPNDDVSPALADPLPAGGVVRVSHVLTWTRVDHDRIAIQTVHRLDFRMEPGSSKTIAKGAPGERSLTIRFTQRDGGRVERTVVSSRVTRKPRKRIVADGVGEYEAFERFAAHGVAKTEFMARDAMLMVATAYTAECAGCSGMTAIGRRAGHGIVAVDPRVIPLGTRLFIPGYGVAVAGDTGGAIRGHRIDLGFDSQRDALLFGRREITVYQLK